MTNSDRNLINLLSELATKSLMRRIDEAPASPNGRMLSKGECVPLVTKRLRAILDSGIPEIRMCIAAVKAGIDAADEAMAA